jgi:segregation and condensation protein B
MFNLSKISEEDRKEEKKEIVSLDQKIEALLFYRGEEVSLNFLVKILAVKKDKIIEAVDILNNRLSNSAISILKNGENFLMVTKKDFSDLISQLHGEESLGELSTSALETLSIILYKGPISKSEIDQIRGVNSSHILRNLLVRGLVERKNISGKTVYSETFDLMRYLAIEKKQDLPGYEKVVEKLDEIDKSDEDTFCTDEKNNIESKR